MIRGVIRAIHCRSLHHPGINLFHTASHCSISPLHQNHHHYQQFSSFSTIPSIMSVPAPISSVSPYFPDPYDNHHLLDKAKLNCADLILSVLPSVFAGVGDLSGFRVDIVTKISKPTIRGRGELCLPCFIFNKKIDPAFNLPPPAIAEKLQTHLIQQLTHNKSSTSTAEQVIERTEQIGAYINFYLSSSYLSSIIPLILNHSFVSPLPSRTQAKVMIEYSQPNCFPSCDHQLLTDKGFMYLHQVESYLASHGKLSVACARISGELEFYDINIGDVTVANGRFHLVDMADNSTYSHTSNVKFSSSNHVNISPTDNHRMWARIGSSKNLARAAFHEISAGDIANANTASGAEPFVQFIANCEKGFAGFGNLKFLQQLGLITTDHLAAFLEFYGYWLGNGWLDMRGCIAVSSRKRQDSVFLNRLFGRLPLPALHSSIIGSNGYCRAANPRKMGQLIYYITSPQWFRFFADEYGVKSASVEEEEYFTIKSAKWFAPWALEQLNCNQIRLLLNGLRFADGNETGTNPDAGTIGTSSIQFRDEILFLALKAGFSAYFAIHTEEDQYTTTNVNGVDVVANHNHWRVYYSADAHYIHPKLSCKHQVKIREYTGQVWCVTVPTPEQLIIFRKVHQVGEDGSILAASRPLIVGNTHKAFHVGHMRNAALGDCLVRLYEQMGHKVVAANYFGDEGAHVAKCIWWLNRYLQSHPQFNIDTDVPVEQRGEWLGGFYTDAVEQLDLSTFTAYPHPYVIPAKVLNIQPHPNSAAPSNWQVVTLQVSASANDLKTVVCGGTGYKGGDHVAYLPLGSKLKGSQVVNAKDMMGVLSEGIMMAEKELGIERPEEEKKEDKAAKKGEKKDKNASKETKPSSAPSSSTSTTPADANKKKQEKSSVSDAASQRIYVLPPSLPLGVPVTESGRLPSASVFPNVSVIDEWEKRKKQVRDTLHGMEHGDRELVAFWQKTRRWSLDEFKRIYAWLNCRFDHDFFESEVSEESRIMAQQYYQNGTFINSNGAVGADLTAFGLGFCMVLKSDGSGLYATKDLALAKRKFEQFGIEQSIYIVDAAQTLHFKQVFKTLEVMGYQQATQCIHLPYGQVILPSGKMSSRAGNVILFSQLKNMLSQDIYEKFLKKHGMEAEIEKEEKQEQNNNNNSIIDDSSTAATTASSSTLGCSYVKQKKEGYVWSVNEIAAAQHAIAVATIKYGMLNHDTNKDIVFIMEEWTAKSGNTGPYMLYAYARIQSIIREVEQAFHSSSSSSSSLSISLPQLSLLTHESERVTLTLLHDFWLIVESCTLRNNPSALCDYLFELSKSFSSWYEQCSIMRAETTELREARLKFIQAIGEVIQVGLGLLGIKTLDRM